MQDKNKTVMEIKLESKQQEIEEKNDPKPVHQSLGQKKIESSPFTDQKLKPWEFEVSPMKEEMPKPAQEIPKDLQRIIVDPTLKTAKQIIEEKDHKRK